MRILGIIVICLALLGLYKSVPAKDVTVDDVKRCVYISNIAGKVQSARQKHSLESPVAYLESINVGEELPMYGLIAWKVFEGFTEDEQPKDVYINLFKHCTATYKDIREGQLDL